MTKPDAGYWGAYGAGAAADVEDFEMRLEVGEEEGGVGGGGAGDVGAGYGSVVALGVGAFPLGVGGGGGHCGGLEDSEFVVGFDVCLVRGRVILYVLAGTRSSQQANQACRI